MMITIPTLILFLTIQFFLLKSHLIKALYVKVRNKYSAPWFRVNDVVIYKKDYYEVIFVFDKGWHYNYYLCKTSANRVSTTCESVPQYKLRKKTKLEKVLE